MASNSLALNFSTFLHKHEEKIAHALPAHISVGRMISAVMGQINASRDLQKCLETDAGKASVMQSAMVAATVGLEPGVLGQAYLIPYNSDKLKSYICTFVPGWKGIISVIGRSGKAMARSGVVFKGDKFDWDTGTGMFVTHKSMATDRDVKKITHVYAIGEIAGLTDRVIEVWDIAQVREHFNRFNKQGVKHYAANDKNWEMYARKVPLLQVAKYLPQTVEITNVVAAAYTAERNENLIVDEQGVPLNAGFQGDDPAPAKAPLRQPRRRDEPAQDAEPKAAGAAALASQGQKNYLKGKAKDDKTLAAALKRAGLTRADWDNLTVDGFTAIKDELK